MKCLFRLPKMYGEKYGEIYVETCCVTSGYLKCMVRNMLRH